MANVHVKQQVSRKEPLQKKKLNKNKNKMRKETKEYSDEKNLTFLPTK